MDCGVGLLGRCTDLERPLRWAAALGGCARHDGAACDGFVRCYSSCIEISVVTLRIDGCEGKTGYEHTV
jgi:hypothetical protein